MFYIYNSLNKLKTIALINLHVLIVSFCYTFDIVGYCTVTIQKKFRFDLKNETAGSGLIRIKAIG